MDRLQRAYYAIRHCGFSEHETRNFLRVPRRVCREWTRNSKERINQRITRKQRERIKEAVLVEGKSYSQTAAEIGCHKQTVGRVIAKLRNQHASKAGGIAFEQKRASCRFMDPLQFGHASHALHSDGATATDQIGSPYLRTTLTRNLMPMKTKLFLSSILLLLAVGCSSSEQWRELPDAPPRCLRPIFHALCVNGIGLTPMDLVRA